MAKTFETTVAVIGIDIGKNSFHIICSPLVCRLFYNRISDLVRN